MISTHTILAAEKTLKRTLDTRDPEESFRIISAYTQRFFHRDPLSKDVALSALHLLQHSDAPNGFDPKSAYRVWHQAQHNAFSTQPQCVGALLILTNAHYTLGASVFAREHLQHIHKHIPDLSAPLVAHALTHRDFNARDTLHAWLCTQPGDWSAVHLHVLQSSATSRWPSLPLDRRALLSLLADPTTHTKLSAILHSFSTQNAPQRRLALFGYQRLQNIAALRTMHTREKTAKLKKELKAAIQEAQKAPVYDFASRVGIYTIGHPIHTQNDLSLLRTLLTEKPSSSLWFRICNVIERLRIAGAGDIAASYAHHTLSSWRKSLRTQPHHWKHFDTLAALAPYKGEDIWLPIATLAHASEKEHLDHTLSTLQGRSRVLLLDHETIQRFITYLQRAWAWCAEHNVEPHHLQMRVDKGRPLSKRPTSFLHTYNGFGVLFGRAADTVLRNPRRAEGLRFSYIKLDRDHPARDTLFLDKRTVNYELPDLEP